MGFGQLNRRSDDVKPDPVRPKRPNLARLDSAINDPFQLDIAKIDTDKRTQNPSSPQPIGFTASQSKLRETIFSALFDVINISKLSALPQTQAEAEIMDIIGEIAHLRGLAMSALEQSMISRSICEELFGLGPIDPLLRDDTIGDIMVHGTGEVFVERSGVIEPTNIRFESDAQLTTICQRLAARQGRHVDQASPLCDTRLPDGSRVNIVLPPLSVHGPALTIRKFAKDRLRLRDLVTHESISPEGARLLAVLAACRANILVSGGTGSGKTTLLNCLTAFIAAHNRVVTVEDVAELQLQQPHVISLESRPPNMDGHGEVTIRSLVRNCLRMRPDRIIVGEVRGPEAFDLLQAMNTGHDGSMGTLHANSPREALSRLSAMIHQSGTSLPQYFIRDMISGAVDIIIQTQRMSDGQRRITHVTEVLHNDGDTTITQDLMLFQPSKSSRDHVDGTFIGTKILRPRVRHKAVSLGLEERMDDILLDLNTA